MGRATDGRPAKRAATAVGTRGRTGSIIWRAVGGARAWGSRLAVFTHAEYRRVESSATKYERHQPRQWSRTNVYRDGLKHSASRASPRSRNQLPRCGRHPPRRRPTTVRPGDRRHGRKAGPTPKARHRFLEDCGRSNICAGPCAIAGPQPAAKHAADVQRAHAQRGLPRYRRENDASVGRTVDGEGQLRDHPSSGIRSTHKDQLAVGWHRANA